MEPGRLGFRPRRHGQHRVPPAPALDRAAPRQLRPGRRAPRLRPVAAPGAGHRSLPGLDHRARQHPAAGRPHPCRGAHRARRPRGVPRLALDPELPVVRVPRSVRRLPRPRPAEPVVVGPAGGGGVGRCAADRPPRTRSRGAAGRRDHRARLDGPVQLRHRPGFPQRRPAHVGGPVRRGAGARRRRDTVAVGRRAAASGPPRRSGSLPSTSASAGTSIRRIRGRCAPTRPGWSGGRPGGSGGTERPAWRAAPARGRNER